MEKPSSHYFHLLIKVNSTGKMTNRQCVLPDERTQHYFCDIPDKKYITNKKTLVKLRDILQNNWLVIKNKNKKTKTTNKKTLNVMKNKH